MTAASALKLAQDLTAIFYISLLLTKKGPDRGTIITELIFFKRTSMYMLL